MSNEPGPRGSLLVVDDEEPQRLMLEKFLTKAGYDVVTAPDGKVALERLGERSFDLLLTDQRMPRLDGLELLEAAQRDHPRLPVVLMTAHGSVSSAVQAMKRGAADYLTKPFERDELLVVVDKALRQSRLEEQVENLQGELKSRYRLGNLVGQSSQMQDVFNLIERVSSTDVSVMISGESGTGKELVARAIHENSPRVNGAFVALNCAAIPETLLESEFFGHERGAFTGATRTHIGRFEQADGGTLFLDEIGAMRFDLQAKLLRAIQEQEVQRLGASQTRKVDVRIVAATSDDLQQAIRSRSFREDLYYRLCVVPIHMPPVRERDDDVPLLVDHFLQRATRKFDRPPVHMAPEVLERLQRFSWPGNVRELENCIERMMVLSTGDRLSLADLPLHMRDGARAGEGSAESFELPVDGVILGDLEARLIQQALSRTRGSLGPAARLLGISYKTLQYRIRKHGLDESPPQIKRADPI
ncbi:MAG: sigma-54 dependent transcriptional regulator [Acidobacteriota bacterium]|nr:sigma-54 dependent transcriptional regulator [Acidobacteriota bacterium]MDH3783816.1 sigma-54 dependent transcriptional regulator [Acidobacteriota bacterium]